MSDSFEQASEIKCPKLVTKNTRILNKKILNVSTSNFIIFHNKANKTKHSLDLNINGENLKQNVSTKYLGLLIDDQLNWKHHIEHLNKKLAKGVGIICKLRHYMPRETLKNIYFSFIQSHLNYGIINGKVQYHQSLNQQAS